MSTSPPIAIIALLLVSCAGWEEPAPAAAPAPDGRPVSSQYAPPPPVRPSDNPPPLAQPAAFRVAIASVQLLDDCPDPTSAPAPAAKRASQRSPSIAGDSAGELRSACSQSSVQLAIHSERPAAFRVEAVRLLRPGSDDAVATALVRGPTTWSPDGTYQPWDQRLPAGTEIKVSYKLGQPAPSRAGQLVSPSFDAYLGVFLLEMDVSVGGQRRTIRSAEFSLTPLEVMVT